MAERVRKAAVAYAGVAAILGVSILGVSMTLMAAQSGSTQTPASDPASTPKTTEQVYKNIKVLKSIPASQLIPAMQFISASLGVKCDHCHAEGHFDSDEKKPKETARKMMAMMFAINKDNFENKREVTCFSCHRGALHPVGIPIIGAAMMPTPESEPPSSPDVSMLPAPSDLIDKYVQASGGADAIGKVTSRVEKGTASGFGHSFPSEAYYKTPDQGAVYTHFPNGESATILSGHAGSMAFPGRPKRPIEGADLGAAEMDSDLHFAIHLKEMFSEFKAAPPLKINDQQAFQVLASKPGQPKVELYFDQQSGMLMRLVRYAESPVGLYPTQIDYADYRETQGVKIPYKITTSHPGSSSTFQIEHVDQNVAIDNAKFAAPAGDAAGTEPKK